MFPTWLRLGQLTCQNLEGACAPLPPLVPASLQYRNCQWNATDHGLRAPGEEISSTARPKINSPFQNFRYSRSIFCMPHRPEFSDFFDLCLHWVSIVRATDWRSFSLGAYSNSLVKPRLIMMGDCWYSTDAQKWICQFIRHSCPFRDSTNYSMPHGLWCNQKKNSPFKIQKPFKVNLI